jgi:serine/threonine protein kinase
LFFQIIQGSNLFQKKSKNKTKKRKKMSDQIFDKIQNHPNLSEVQRFTQKYYLRRTLTSGKFNAVASAHNKNTFQKVIIKAIYNPEYCKLKEAAILKKLQHVPGVIQYMDHFLIEPTIHLLALEYFGQMTLSGFLSTEAPVSESTAYTIFNQLFFTAHACFQQNILHRKLKPSNILINVRTLEIKITNFNSASQFDYQEFTSQLCQDIAPPEYFIFGTYTADGLYVWSLGLILYELLFNCKPFLSIHEIMNKVLTLPCHKQNLSLDVKLFLRWTLEKTERITLHQIMHHPWLTKQWR